MRKMTFLLILIVGIMALVSCSLGDPQPDACVGSGTLFQDDFGGEQECGWALYNQGGAVTEIADGVLRISTSQPGQIWWTNPGRNFDNVIVTVQARQSSGPDDNAYGIICRYQNEQNFYLFLISGDGYYAVGKYQSGNDQIVYLTENAQYQFSDVINQGVATNQVRASCIGNELSLAVNGLPLFTTTDPTFVTGDIGVGVSTLEPGTAVVEFDNIVVIAP
ncbi:MAG: hypothetical protein R3E31_24270 [Chloroflexota bacterium]|nr:hypothetical protein [Anaerolineales bacterium]MCB8968617.1 hypothetical protein [Ardenticatenaceae bacterium]